MTTILFAILSSMLLFALVGSTLVVLLSSGPRSYKWPGIILALFLICSSYTLYRVYMLFKPRTGIEIYTAIMGAPRTECVVVKDWFDPVVPLMDDQLLLHFRTCPKEMQRILAGHTYSAEKTSILSCGYTQNYVDWWQPQTLGDSVWVFDAMEHDRMRGEVIISNLDSTEAYFLDM